MFGLWHYSKRRMHASESKVVGAAGDSAALGAGEDLERRLRDCETAIERLGNDWLIQVAQLQRLVRKVMRLAEPGAVAAPGSPNGVARESQAPPAASRLAGLRGARARIVARRLGLHPVSGQPVEAETVERQEGEGDGLHS